jgi:ubiquinol-cytochrome c reductase cytochrome c1 subunit
MTDAMTTSSVKTSMFPKLVALLVAGLMAVGVVHAAEEEGMASANVRLDDVASMQRGARLFFNYCSGCHSLQYLRYSRIADDLQLDPKDVEKNFVFTGGKIGDHAISHMPPEQAATWFGKAPPDLSLEARAKGSDWIYNYLKSFYLDPSRPLGWNNTVFANVSMPNPLWQLQGQQIGVVRPASAGHDAGIEKLELKTPGTQTPEQFDRTVRDITAFLQYAGEPAALKREAMGVWVLLYLAFFTLIAWLLKHEFWKDVH